MNAAGLAQRSLAPVKTSAIGHSLAFEEHLTASGVASRTTHLVPPILRVSPAGVACGSYNYQNATLYWCGAALTMRLRDVGTVHLDELSSIRQRDCRYNSGLEIRLPSGSL
jgi:hypothetical protein